jgi:hypothetical protein
MHKERTMHKRHLKVRQVHRDYFHKTNPYAGNPIIPLILLKGTWLKEAGFIINLPICVQVEKKELIITPRN